MANYKIHEATAKEIDEYLFLSSKGKRYTTAGFRSSLMKQCSLQGILDGEYVFKGYGYQKEFCKALYRNRISIQAIREIKSIQEEGRHVSVSDLAKRTGLSKGFFYKNEEVRVELDASKRKEKAAQMDGIRREIAQHSIEVQNALYQKELEKLRKENKKLKKDNQKLTKLLERARL